jgi:hypothetical protein
MMLWIDTMNTDELKVKETLLQPRIDLARIDLDENGNPQSAIPTPGHN